jgi:uncharacterized membrane protein (UPF0127 family)
MRGVFLVLALFAVGCKKPEIAEDFTTTELTLPGGRVIKVETMITSSDLRRGMTFRTSLAPDHGMLFVHPTIGNYRYWMYQVEIPLDIIWLDNNRQIVEMVVNAQPCKTEPTKCPQWASGRPAHYVLELAGGMAKKYNLRIGEQLSW